MKQLFFLLFFFFSICAFCQQDSIKIDTLEAFIVIENPATDDPQEVFDGIVIVTPGAGYIMKKLLGINRMQQKVYADVPKNEFTHPIIKKQ